MSLRAARPSAKARIHPGDTERRFPVQTHRCVRQPCWGTVIARQADAISLLSYPSTYALQDLNASLALQTLQKSGSILVPGSFCAAHLRPVSAKLWDTPDLQGYGYVDGSGAHVDLAHFLLQPFGPGLPTGGAPPTTLQTEPEQDIDIEDASEQIHAMMILLTPQYTADVVVIHLDAPATIQEALDEMEDIRFADRRRRFPTVLPAVPQLTRRFAVFVALPAWSDGLSTIVADCRSFQHSVYAARVTPVASRESLLALTEIPVSQWDEVHVVVGHADRPLAVGQNTQVADGWTVFFWPASSHGERGPNLADMLSSSQGWEVDAPVPERSGPAFWLLTDAQPCRYVFSADQIANRSDTRLRTCVAEVLGCSSSRLTMRVARPRMEDHAICGQAHKGIVVANLRIPRPIPFPPVYKVVAFDARPILQEVVWDLVQGSAFRLHTIVQRYQPRCPRFYTVVVSGGRPYSVGNEAWISFDEGQTLTIDFVADQHQSQADSSSAGEDGDESESDNTADTVDEPGSTSSSARSRTPRSARATVSAIPHRDECVDSLVPTAADEITISVDGYSSGYVSGADAMWRAHYSWRCLVDGHVLLTPGCSATNQGCPADDFAGLLTSCGRGDPPDGPAALLNAPGYTVDSPGLSEDRPDPSSATSSSATTGHQTPGDDLPPMPTERESNPFANLLLTPDYTSEIVFTPQIAVPSLLQVWRTPRRKALFDQLLPVDPQPSGSFATWLALPSWALTSSVLPTVCFDTRLVDGRLFCAPAPVSLDAAGVLRLLTRDMPFRCSQAEVDIYVGGCLLSYDGSPVTLHCGTLVRLVPAQFASNGVQAEASSSTVGPDSGGLFCERHEPPCALILHDDRTSIRYCARHRALPQKEMLDGELQCASEQSSLQPIHVSGDDIARQGYGCKHVAVYTVSLAAASRLSERGVERGRPVALDCRPLLLGFKWAVVIDGWLDASAVEQMLVSSISPELRPCVLGPNPRRVNGRTYLPAEPGQMFEVVPLVFEETGAEDASDTHSVSGPTQADSTSAGLSEQDVSTPEQTVSRAIRAHSPRRHTRQPHTGTIARLLRSLVIAVCCPTLDAVASQGAPGLATRGTAVNHSPATSQALLVAGDGSGPVFAPGFVSRGDASIGPLHTGSATEHTYVNGHVDKAPSTGFPSMRPVATPSRARSCNPPLLLPFDPGPTLLEESIRRPTSTAMWEVATLVETLYEHFGHLGQPSNDTVPCLLLAQHLPSTPCQNPL